MKTSYILVILFLLTTMSCADDFETDCDKITSEIKSIGRDYDTVKIYLAMNSFGPNGAYTIEGNFIKVGDYYINLCEVKRISYDSTSIQLYYY